MTRAADQIQRATAQSQNVIDTAAAMIVAAKSGDIPGIATAAIRGSLDARRIQTAPPTIETYTFGCGCGMWIELDHPTPAELAKAQRTFDTHECPVLATPCTHPAARRHLYFESARAKYKTPRFTRCECGEIFEAAEVARV